MTKIFAAAFIREKVLAILVLSALAVTGATHAYAQAGGGGGAGGGAAAGGWYGWRDRCWVGFERVSWWRRNIIRRNGVVQHRKFRLALRLQYERFVGRGNGQHGKSFQFSMTRAGRRLVVSKSAS